MLSVDVQNENKKKVYSQRRWMDFSTVICHWHTQHSLCQTTTTFYRFSSIKICTFKWFKWVRMKSAVMVGRHYNKISTEIEWNFWHFRWIVVYIRTDDRCTYEIFLSKFIFGLTNVVTQFLLVRGKFTFFSTTRKRFTVLFVPCVNGISNSVNGQDDLTKHLL